MKRILITGGTVFVSRYAAEYFVNAGYDVYVLNRNTRPQPAGVKLIEADRHCPGDRLKGLHFDAICDITAYNAEDIRGLLRALGSFDMYIMISSSAVYPEYGAQPFTEDTQTAENRYWGAYGINKAEAERALTEGVKDAYIIRPPYLYGPMNNVYREAFVFDCALAGRRFFLPGDGMMPLQFFHVRDLCRLMRSVIENRPAFHIMNCGNTDTVTVKDWVTMCYRCLGKEPVFEHVYLGTEQRKYFCFYDYDYRLDVSRQSSLLPDPVPLQDGLAEAAEWYLAHPEEVNRKPYMEFIDANL